MSTRIGHYHFSPYFPSSLIIMLLLALERFIATCMPLKSLDGHVYKYRAMIGCGWLHSFLISSAHVIQFYIYQSPLINSLCVMMISVRDVHIAIVRVVCIVNTSVAFLNITLYTLIFNTLLRRQKKKEAPIVVRHIRQSELRQSDVAITLRIVLTVLSSLHPIALLFALLLYYQ